MPKNVANGTTKANITRFIFLFSRMTSCISPRSSDFAIEGKTTCAILCLAIVKISSTVVTTEKLAKFTVDKTPNTTHCSTRGRN